MTAYRTCVGCALQGKPCVTRAAMREKLAGLGVTSIKWKCKSRLARFLVGDPVFAFTLGCVEEGEAYMDHFPAVVVEVKGANAIVFIESGAAGLEDVPFEPKGSGNGFCKIPLSRLREREGERETICPSCGWPARKGHQEGYGCTNWAERAGV